MKLPSLKVKGMTDCRPCYLVQTNTPHTTKKTGFLSCRCPPASSNHRVHDTLGAKTDQQTDQRVLTKHSFLDLFRVSRKQAEKNLPWSTISTLHVKSALTHLSLGLRKKVVMFRDIFWRMHVSGQSSSWQLQKKKIRVSFHKNWQ